jgi:hypothetical protein
MAAIGPEEAPVQTIVPMLDYEDGAAAMDSLCRAFGLKERTRLL